jgi:MFS family permease
MNSGSAVAAVISPVVSGYLIDRTGNWQLPFVGSMVLMGVGVLLACRMRPDSKFEEPNESIAAANSLRSLS